ncbi:MAG: hypothetical protein HY762_00230 [Planctomycetes bacterium]|nr:hypothetical protein [Planctomycetota bacterium]
MYRLWMISGIILTLVLSACGSDKKSDAGSSSAGTVVIVGEVGTGYSVVYVPPKNIFEKFCSIFTPNKAFAAWTGGGVNKVIAIQVEGGYIGSYFIQTAKEATLGTDGKFSLSLEKDKDWMLLLVDTTAPTDKEKFVGYVSLKVDATDNLLMVPATTASSGTLNLGKVDKSGDEAVSTNAVTATNFAMTADGLMALAKNDELFKAVKNIFINYKNGTYYNLRPDFKWEGQYNSLKNNFQDAAAYNFVSYQFQLDTNDGLTLNDICDADGGVPLKLMELYPPADVPTNGGAITYSPTAPLSNSNLQSPALRADGLREVWSSGSSVFYAGEGTYDGGATLSYSWASRMLTGTVPAGYWTYKIGGVTKGEFDCAVATPLTTDFKIKGFVPVIRVNTDATDKITSVDVKWYTLSGTSYTEVTDTSALKYLISADMSIGNQYGGTRKTDKLTFDSTMSSATPTMTWYFGTAGSDPAQQAESFMIFYSIGGVGHFFEWFR